MESPVTQINYLTISKDTTIEEPNSKAGQAWEKILDIFEQSDGFIRSYWGRSPEDVTKVQLHVVKEFCSQHQDFEKTQEYTQIHSLLNSLTTPGSKPYTRHASIREFTPAPQNKALGNGAPFTGSAVYLSTDTAWHDGAWPLWTHIVRHVDGCLGVTGGKVLESVEGKHNCYVVYVGWESLEKHDQYHHTRHFANRGVVLALGHEGWREYGHVTFRSGRDKGRVVETTAKTSRNSRL